MNLTIFDVDNGACALLESDNGARLMIDCGHNATNDWYPGKYLESRGIDRLDLLAITNYDENHLSGLRDLLDRVRVDALWRNESVSPAMLPRLKTEDGMGSGIATLVRMATGFIANKAPQPRFEGLERAGFCNEYPAFDDENNLSLVVELRCSGLCFLFAGDLGRAGWLALLRGNPAFRTAVARTDVLIASHQGRESGICPEIFENHGCKPFFVVFSGKGGGPEIRETMDYYHRKSKGTYFGNDIRHVLTTHSDGAIQFQISPDGSAWSADRLSAPSGAK
jgi:beta-lactamase superfamily II metal-dependent hydrolase